MVEKSIIETIKFFMKALGKENIRADKVILYGSYAAGRQREDSDIDVAVISKDFGQDTVEEGMNLFRIACDMIPAWSQCRFPWNRMKMTRGYHSSMKSVQMNGNLFR